MKPPISVIVPAYNAAGHIGDTLESIITQDYGNIEIIVVNDASTDGTGDIARSVLEKSGRPWRIIDHERNRGVSAARNAGFYAAKGEYVHFMDADDLLDRNFFSLLMDLALKNGSDIVCCGYREREKSTGRETYFPFDKISSEKLTSEDLALESLFGRFLRVLWTSLFKKSFLARNGLDSVEGSVSGQDTEFLVKALVLSEKTSFTHECPYLYLLHDAMGSRAANATKEQIIRRTESMIRCQFRMAGFIMRNAKSAALRNAAMRYLLPKMHLKMFNIYAWRGDRGQFDKSLRCARIRKILLSSLGAFTIEPQIFLKTIWLMSLPDSYYKFRQEHIYGRRV